MRFPLLPLALVLSVAGFMAPTSAHAATCKTMIYFDQNGAVVATPQPVAAILLAGTPITGPVDVPGAVRREVGGDMECPKALVDQIQGLFDDSCLSEERRTKTAAANNIDVAALNKRCADMGEALHPRKQ